MTVTLEQLRQQTAPDPESVDRFIADNDFPIVDESGATFVYRGVAEQVLLRHWIYGLPSSQPLEPLEGTDLWTLRLDLPRRSRIEYKFDVVSEGNNNWIMDPLNPNVAMDPFGANSVCGAYGYERPGWTLPDTEARPGALEEISLESRAFDDTRRVMIYTPPRFRRTRRYPLLIAHDGADYLRFSDLKIVLDNLIHRLEIPPWWWRSPGPAIGCGSMPAIPPMRAS